MGLAGSELGLTGSGMGLAGSELGLTGSGMGLAGSELGLTGSGMGLAGSELGLTGSGMGLTGSDNDSNALLTSSNTSIVIDFLLASFLPRPPGTTGDRACPVATVGNSLSLSSEGARLALGVAEAALAIIEFNLPRSEELRLAFFLMVPFLPVDLRVVPALISFSKLSIMHPSSSGSGTIPTLLPASPLASALFLLASSAAFLAASLFTLFCSTTTL